MLSSRPTRAAAAVVAVLGLGITLFFVASLLAPPTGQLIPTSATRVVAQSSITELQQRLKRLPNDWDAWAALGVAYLDQGVATADPAYYSKADGALQRSLQIKPHANAAALTGQAAVAASRHNFRAALTLARSSQRLNPYSATNQGVLVDALVELGYYPQAEVELQRMMDLRPSVPAYTRVSYFRELHGDISGARSALVEADAHTHAHDHAHGAHHVHPPAPHSHGLFSHTHEPTQLGTRSLLAVGFTGGMVPSPSALLVLLGGIALGRAWFGMVLVVAYGLGMATALVAVGLALVKCKDWLDRHSARLTRAGHHTTVTIATRWLPAATSALVILIGLGVAARAASAI